MKTCCLSIVFLLYGNSSKQLALFFCSFRERTSAEFSKCFQTQLLMVNVKKTWCSSTIFLLHGNANKQFVFWNAMKTTCSSIVIIISCSWSCLMKTPVNSLFNIQSTDNDWVIWAVWVIWGSWALASELDINIRWKSSRLEKNRAIVLNKVQTITMGKIWHEIIFRGVNSFG